MQFIDAKSRVIGLFLLGQVLLLGGCKSRSNSAISDQASSISPPSETQREEKARPIPSASGNEVKGDTIPIGLVATVSGELSPWGTEIVKAARLAVEACNKAGGLHGKSVELIVGDSASKPEQGKTAAERLISKGVIGLIGDLTSGITTQIAKTAFEKGIPLITPGGTEKEITDIGSNIFRICYTNDVQGPIMARFAFEELKLRNVAILTDKKQPYSNDLSKNFRKTFLSLGGKIADEQCYESGQTQFSAQITNLKAKNPDGLFISGYYTEVGPLVRQAVEAGLDVPKFGGDGWDSDELLNTGGEAILGGFNCTHFSYTEKRKETEDFLKAWKSKYHEKPKVIPASLAYDAVRMMLNAIRRSDHLNSNSLAKAIEETTDFNGVTGNLTMKGACGTPPKRAVVVEMTPEGQVFRKAYERLYSRSGNR